MKNLFSIILFGLATLMFAPMISGELPENMIMTQQTLGITAGILFVVGLVYSVKSGVLNNIAVQDSRSIITKTTVAIYKELPMVTAFLMSFFVTKESLSQNVSIEVQRGSEKVAVDVLRGTPGNLNRRTLSTEKIFKPPYFDEGIIMNDTDLYYQAIASQTDTAFAMLAEEFAVALEDSRNKILRRYELMCAQVLESGIVTLKNGDNVDFKRKALSKVDLLAGNYWDNTSVNPFDTIALGCKFIREEGKSQGIYYNAIFGSEALSALMNSEFYKERNVLVNSPLDSVHPPIKNSVGGTLHGEITCGSYKVRVWTYNEIYEDVNGDFIPYKDPKTVVILPDVPKFVMAYAAVPQLIKNGTVPQKGAFLVQDLLNDEATVHTLKVKSAGIPIPVAVDQIYTVQVVAS